ncbi:MAG: hypothetical protein PHF86_10540, partial [Candidatus Nanoarchaeia archaeon]|nr:hypothetical protein [Candidatus Nanoarchaeia archaeon]
PIKQKFDTCLESITIDALKLAGSQSGYVQVPINNVPINPSIPFSNTLETFNGNKVPFWFYQINGQQQKQIPELIDTQSQIADYIATNIKSCNSILDEFTQQGYEFDISYIVSPQVEIQDEAVISSVSIPIKISVSGLNFDLSQYPVVSNVKIPYGRLYKIARGIQDTEDKTNFFEEKTFDAMVAYSEIPLSGTEFSCAKKFWTKQDVLQSMKDIISSNINAIRLTGNYKDPNNDYFNLDSKQSTTNINTQFLYSNKWPMYMDVYPSSGDLLKSDQLSQHFSDQVSGIITSILCINNWHFVYDVQYPILISLVDSTALDNTGFAFQFADLVIIENNQPKKNVLGTYDQPDFKFPVCKYPITNITVNTYTLDNNGMVQNLDNVDINFKCFTTKCSMGVTGNSEYGETSITTQFPQCLNGLITGEKEGYYKADQMLSTNEAQTVSLILEPIKRINYNVNLIEKDTGNIREPYDSETIIFNLKNLDNDFSTSFVYPGITQIDLIPGNYEVKSYIIANSTWPITIKGQTFEKCVDTPQSNIFGIIFKDRKCFSTKTEDLVVNEVIKGGADFQWTLTRDDLNNKDSITFYTMVDQIPSNFESLNLIYSEIQKNAKNKNFKEPN